MWVPFVLWLINNCWSRQIKWANSRRPKSELKQRERWRHDVMKINRKFVFFLLDGTLLSGTAKLSLRSGSMFVSLWKLHSDGQGETKREPDTNLLRNVFRPLFWLIDICRISQPKLLPLLVFLVCNFSCEKCRLADLKNRLLSFNFFS